VPSESPGGPMTGITRVNRGRGLLPRQLPAVSSRGMGGGEPTAVQTPVLSGLEPQVFWGLFDALTRIARPSRQEEVVATDR
jgi:hypothetical protein